MAELLFGVETEYAVTGVTPRGTIDREEILQGLMEGARERLVHLPDMHSSSGVFLQNGARFYADCGLHPEICTPECANPWDAVRYIQAGHRILASLAASIESASTPGTEILCFRGNVDYSGTQATWGCHESYLHRISLDALQPQLIPHLVTRLIYTGAGGFNPLARGLEFSLSPRMAHFQRVVAGSSTSDRGIWHTKSESLCSGYRRLHVLCGESLCSVTATFLKIGVTALIVAMADAGLAPGSAVQLADPLEAMRKVAGDVTCKRALRMADGSLMNAIDLQRYYLELAEAHMSDSFMPAWAAEVCGRWRTVLNQLEDAPSSVEQTLDWGIKRALYANHARSLGIRWEDLPFWNDVIAQMAGALDARTGSEIAIPLELAIRPHRRIPKDLTFLEPILQTRSYKWEDLRTVLNCRQRFFEIDTRFGQLGPNGIFETLDLAGVLNHRVSGVDNIEHAMTDPPASGRARVRGQVIRRLAGTGNASCNWQIVVNRQDGQMLDLSDPFIGEESWQPWTTPNRSDGNGDVWQPDPNNPYTRRQDAADRILSGDYAGAERLLRELQEESFCLPSTNCHLARVLLMTDRETEARAQIDLASAIREQAPGYVAARILFFQYVFAIFDGVETASIMGQIRAALCVSGAHLDWTILPMLDRLRPRLGETNYQFLEALAEALSDSRAMPRLEEFPEWRNAAVLTAQ